MKPTITPTQQSRATTFTLKKRIAYLKRYGTHCNAFASFQPNMHYFDVAELGFIPYTLALGQPFVLSDPICKPDHVATLVTHFLQQFPNTIWIQISPELSNYLSESHGLYGTQIGTESKVPLNTWTMEGTKRRGLRKTVHQAKAQGITIAEEPHIASANAQHEELAQASTDWLKTRVVKQELNFLVRPMEMGYQENCRYFLARKEGRVVGYIYFDPIYRNGKVIAYAPNVSRSYSDFKRGLWYTMMIYAMDIMKQEGIEYIDLGFMPAHVSQEINSHESILVHKLMEFIYEHCGWLYSCKGLQFAKSRFDGTVTKTFLAHRSQLPLLSIAAILHKSGVISGVNILNLVFQTARQNLLPRPMQRAWLPDKFAMDAHQT